MMGYAGCRAQSPICWGRAQCSTLPFFSGFFFLFSALGGELWTAAGGEAAGGGPDAAGGAGSDLHSTEESPDVMVTQTKRRGTQRYDLQHNTLD